MTFKKQKMTIPNKLYGDREVDCYVYMGVAVARTGAGWGVYHHCQGVEVFYKLKRGTLREAKEVARQVAELDVDWTREPGDRRFEEEFRASVGEIRKIAG